MAEFFPLLDGIGSIVLGMVILLMTGLMVSVFIGDSIILSGLRGEKKVVDKTAAEIQEDEGVDERILNELEAIEKKLEAQKKKSD